MLLIQAVYYYNRFEARQTNQLQASMEVARAAARAFDEFIGSILHQEAAIGVHLTFSPGTSVEQMNQILEANRAEHPAIRNFFWISPQGRVVASSWRVDVDADLSDRDYFREISAGREWVLSDLLLSRSTGQPIFSISRGIRDGDGNLLGIVSAAVLPDKLGSVLSFELSHEGTIILLDTQGRAVYAYPKVDWEWQDRLVDGRLEMREALGGKEVLGTFPCFATGEERMVAMSPARLSGWVISASRLKQAVMSPIQFEIFLQLALSFFVTIVVFLAAMAISRNITAPIAKLREHALAIGSGKAGSRIEVIGSSELKELAMVLNAMAGQIERREEALRLEEVRFEALYALSQMSEESKDEILDFALGRQQRITKSKIGFICFLNDDETACTSVTWTKSTMRECGTRERLNHSPIDEAGLWADVVRKRGPVSINEYSDPALPRKGLPTGHVPLHRFLAVPIFEGEHIVAVAAVANKEEEYNYSDLRQLTLLMEGTWSHIQRREAEKALLESKNLAAIGQAMSAVAHDMKTPLISIGGFARQVQNHLDHETPEYGKLEIVVQETSRLEKMLKDMLDFSKPLRLERSHGDVCRLIEECLLTVQPRAQQRKVSILNDSDELFSTVSFDALRIKQVLINLLTNAVEASQEGAPVSIRSRQNGKFLVIEVSDSGPGIPVSEGEKIFSPFFTTKKEGTGLGLPIVKKIVEAHQGRIEVFNNPDKGATFRVLIPFEGE